MHRLIPQWFARWRCGRAGHPYVLSWSAQVDGQTVNAISCRCGEDQQAAVHGGRFPRKRVDGKAV